MKLLELGIILLAVFALVTFGQLRKWLPSEGIINMPKTLILLFGVVTTAIGLAVILFQLN